MERRKKNWHLLSHQYIDRSTCVYVCVHQKYINKSEDKQKNRGNGRVDKSMCVCVFEAKPLTHTYTLTCLSDATLEGGFNLMCLMLTLVARNTHTHPLFQPACHFISWDLIYSFHVIFFIIIWAAVSNTQGVMQIPASLTASTLTEDPSRPSVHFPAMAKKACTVTNSIVPHCARPQFPACMGALIGCTADCQSTDCIF